MLSWRLDARSLLPPLPDPLQSSGQLAEIPNSLFPGKDVSPSPPLTLFLKHAFLISVFDEIDRSWANSMSSRFQGSSLKDIVTLICFISSFLKKDFLPISYARDEEEGSWIRPEHVPSVETLFLPASSPSL